MIKHALSLLFIFLAPTTPIMCCSELAHLKWYESISKIIPASNVVENSNFMSFNEDPRKEPQIEVAEDKIPLGLTIKTNLSAHNDVR